MTDLEKLDKLWQWLWDKTIYMEIAHNKFSDRIRYYSSSKSRDDQHFSLSLDDTEITRGNNVIYLEIGDNKNISDFDIDAFIAGYKELVEGGIASGEIKIGQEGEDEYKKKRKEALQKEMDALDD